MECTALSGFDGETLPVRFPWTPGVAALDGAICAVELAMQSSVHANMYATAQAWQQAVADAGVVDAPAMARLLALPTATSQASSTAARIILTHNLHILLQNVGTGAVNVHDAGQQLQSFIASLIQAAQDAVATGVDLLRQRAHAVLTVAVAWQAMAHDTLQQATVASASPLESWAWRAQLRFAAPTGASQPCRISILDREHAHGGEYVSAEGMAAAPGSSQSVQYALARTLVGAHAGGIAMLAATSASISQAVCLGNVLGVHTRALTCSSSSTYADIARSLQGASASGSWLLLTHVSDVSAHVMFRLHQAALVIQCAQKDAKTTATLDAITVTVKPSYRFIVAAAMGAHAGVQRDLLQRCRELCRPLCAITPSAEAVRALRHEPRAEHTLAPSNADLTLARWLRVLAVVDTPSATRAAQQIMGALTACSTAQSVVLVHGPACAAKTRILHACMCALLDQIVGPSASARPWEAHSVRVFVDAVPQHLLDAALSEALQALAQQRRNGIPSWLILDGANWRDALQQVRSIAERGDSGTFGSPQGGAPCVIVETRSVEGCEKEDGVTARVDVDVHPDDWRAAVSAWCATACPLAADATATEELSAMVTTALATALATRWPTAALCMRASTATVSYTI